ncbi:MAG: hypothetical protein PUB98_07070 [Clostridiales bacterium]|nr:hypothetical protein [Clostridiales bacterium]
MRKWMRGTAFVVIGSLLFTLLSEVMLTKWVFGLGSIQRMIEGYRAEKEDTLDFIFFGNSRMVVSVNPAVLWDEYGITSYNYSAMAQTIPLTYYYMEEALKTQQPKAIILNVTSNGNKVGASSDELHYSLDYMPWSSTKIDAITNCVPQSEWLEYVFPIIYSHDNWKRLNGDYFKNMYVSGENEYKGYGFMDPYAEEIEYPQYDYPYDMEENMAQYYYEEAVDAEVLEWYQKIIDLTEQSGVDLILIGVPNGTPPEVQGNWNPIFQYAMEKGVTCINYNLQMTGLAHNPADNAEAFTKRLGKDLLDLYEIEERDKRAPEFEGWNQAVLTYGQEWNAAKLRNTVNQEEWFELVENENYTLFFAVDTEVLKGQQILDRLSDLGEGEDDLTMYEGKVFGVITRDETMYYYELGASKVYAEYEDTKARLSAEETSIMEIKFKNSLIRGKNCSIMVYDNVLQRVVDGVIVNSDYVALSRENMKE